MNTQHLFAAAAIAFMGTGAFASEATQFDIPAGTLTRAEVKAELNRALAAGELNGPSELYGQAAPVTAGVRSRAEVRAEAVKAARDNRFNMLYVGA